jgi:hypothetical protein
MSDEKFTAHQLYSLIRSTYPDPGFITLEEVRDATGFDGIRTADAIAIGMYRSRGKLIHGFEIKVSRADWQKELTQPSKAESIMRYCHHWSVVVPSESIVHSGELPPTWGMFVPGKNRLKAVAPPPMLEPLPMSMTMLTALLYAVSKVNTRADEKALREAKDDGYKQGLQRGGDFAERFRNLEERVREFEKASGLNVQYASDKIIPAMGSAVQALMRGDAQVKHILSDLKFLQRSGSTLEQTAALQIAEIEKFFAAEETAK